MYVRLFQGMARRTKQDAQVTRNLILDKAEAEFLRRGVSRSSLQDIAKAAGVTRGAVYWHFRDKADLFNAMLKRVSMPLEQEIIRSGEPGLDDPVAQIRYSFINALRSTVKNPQARRVFEIAINRVEYVEEMEVVRDRRLKGLTERLAQVERGFKLAMRLGRLERRMPARAAAIGLHSLVDGLMQNWLLDPCAFDLLRVGRQAIDAYLVGMGAVGAGHARSPQRLRP
jgi:TetR/AcrR family transcriptional regulator, acrAB operon repressor